MEDLSGVPFSAISVVFKFVEFGFALKEVTTENRVFLDLLRRVRKDLEEAYRGKRENTAALERDPGKAEWIDGTIYDTNKALSDIGELIESARIRIEKGKSVTLKDRFIWVLQNRQKFITYDLRLRTCHQSLATAINDLHAFSMSRTWAIPPVRLEKSVEVETKTMPPTYPLLKSPSMRRPKHTSGLSVTVAPVGSDDYSSVNSMFERSFHTYLGANTASIGSQETLIEYVAAQADTVPLQRSRSVAEERRQRASNRFYNP